MNWAAIGLAIGASLLSHTTSFRVGRWRVSASDAGGKPVHFDFTAALTGATKALATGEPWSGQSGDIKITVEPWT